MRKSRPAAPCPPLLPAAPLHGCSAGVAEGEARVVPGGVPVVDGMLACRRSSLKTMPLTLPLLARVAQNPLIIEGLANPTLRTYLRVDNVK